MAEQDGGRPHLLGHLVERGVAGRARGSLGPAVPRTCGHLDLPHHHRVESELAALPRRVGSDLCRRRLQPVVDDDRTDPTSS